MYTKKFIKLMKDLYNIHQQLTYLEEKDKPTEKEIINRIKKDLEKYMKG